MKKRISILLLLGLVLLFADADAFVLANEAIESDVIASVGFPYYDTGFEKKRPQTKSGERSGYTGYVTSWDEIGSWVEWMFEIPEEGDYYFFVQYATHAERGAQCSLAIDKVYGEENYVKIDEINFPLGGNWGSEGWLMMKMDKTVHLQAGKTIARLTLLPPKNAEQTGMNVVNLGFIKAENGKLVLDDAQIVDIVDQLLYP